MSETGKNDGYVLLSFYKDGREQYYVPRFTRCENEFAPNELKNKLPFFWYKKHWLAWRQLLKEKFGKGFEPSNLNNNNVYKGISHDICN